MQYEFANNVEWGEVGRVGAAVAEFLTMPLLVLGMVIFLSGLYGLFKDNSKTPDPEAETIKSATLVVVGIFVGLLGPIMKRLFENMG